MQLSRFLLASVSLSLASAAPSSYDLTTSSPAAPLSSWLSTTLQQWVSSSAKPAQDAHDAAVGIFNGKVSPFEMPDYSDKSIWEVIQENEHLTDLKRVLKYAGPKSKELLDDKSKKLTFLAPINWHHGDHHDEVALTQWEPIQRQIDEMEHPSSSSSDDDEDRKEKKRRAIAYLIDSTLKYHVIDSHKPLKASEVAQNSSVATLLNIGHGKAREILGNLFDGEQFRLRVGKSLLPTPGAYFNFYSKLVYPDVNVGGSIVHAISFPLVIPPSSLQVLFFAQNEFSALTSALQKVHVEGYLKLPLNESYMHHHHHNNHSSKSDAPSALHPFTREEHHHHHHQAPGQGAQTLFAPANLAWSRLPIKLRLFLFSPFGTRVLQKVLALHALPHNIFFADFVHDVTTGKNELGNTRQSTVSVFALNKMFGEILTTSGPAYETNYTFDTACPKLHFNKTSQIWTEREGEFEQVDVSVYRYYLLPGGKGPLQTRVSVQGVPVLFQDIATSNGAIHQIERFIMPKSHHHHHHHGHGIWAHVAHEAKKAGFGSVDVSKLEL